MSLRATEHGTLRQVLWFLVIGGLSAATDAGGFVLLTTVGVIPAAASALSFCAAFAVNYSGNRDIVFRGASTDRALRRYVAVVALNLVLSTVIVAALVAADLVPIVAKIISMVAVATGNYFMLRLWVFPRPAPAPDPAP